MNTNPEWKLVPVEPTPKMIDATWDHSVDRDGGIESQSTRNRRIYAAMLASAPEAPPLTVTVDPDARGVSVGVYQGTRCVYSGAHPIPASTVATEGEKDERQAFEADERERKSNLSYEWRTEEYADPWVMERWRTWRRAWEARATIAAPAAGDALDALVNNLAGMAYQYAVALDQATRDADSDELEGIARRITGNLKEKMRAAIAQQSQRKEAT